MQLNQEYIKQTYRYPAKWLDWQTAQQTLKDKGTERRDQEDKTVEMYPYLILYVRLRNMSWNWYVKVSE